jgi:hypothetical protein
MRTQRRAETITIPLEGEELFDRESADHQPRELQAVEDLVASPDEQRD